MTQDRNQGKTHDKAQDKTRDRKERLGALLSAAGIAVLFSIALWTYFFVTPCRIEADCRGMEVDAAQIRSWEEQERANPGGILDMAGWRIGGQQAVFAVSTGRRKTSAVLEVCGSAALVFPAEILSGDYALPSYETESGGGGMGNASSQTPEMAAGALSRIPPACILTKELSDALFGSTDSAGETVKVGDEILTVAGVIDKEGLFLLKSAAGGRMDYVAFRMSRRYQARARARQLVTGGA